MFQSTRPRGERLISTAQTTGFGVSIHAPTWGATTEQHTYHWYVGQFQSTRPRGARLLHAHHLWVLKSFNPRAHVGRDSLLDKSLIIKDKVNAFCEHVSIHAPTWGATAY